MILMNANQTTTAPTHTMINRSRYSQLGFPGNVEIRTLTSSFREVFTIIQVNLNWLLKTMMTWTLRYESSLPLEVNRTNSRLPVADDEVIHG